VAPEIGEVLTKVISLNFHQTLMAASGDLAIEQLYDTQRRYHGEYVLIVEGTVPVGAKGRFATLGERAGRELTVADWVRSLAQGAKAVVSVGSCAAFGGIPAGKPNPTDSYPVSAVVDRTRVVNLPGCPSHPDWVLGTVVHLVNYGLPKLDNLRRPSVFYGRCIHDLCERREYFDLGQFAVKYSDPGCLYQLGCKGPMTFADCPVRQFNGGTNWCVGAGSPCLSCVEPGFPDTSAPFFVRMPEYGPAGTQPPVAKPVRLLGGED
jgi:hydrogenase small subunit